MSNTAKVSALLHADSTEVGAEMTTITDTTPAPPLKVLLLGLGEVGQGVYQYLQVLPEFFELLGIHVRDVFKHVENGAPRALLDIHMAIAQTEEKARACASLPGLHAYRLPPLQLKQQQHIQYQRDE